MMTDTLLSILILTYNDGRFLEGCLNSIREHVSCSFEVILVHNGSSEPLPEGITERYPWLRVIRSESTALTPGTILRRKLQPESTFCY